MKSLFYVLFLLPMLGACGNTSTYPTKAVVIQYKQADSPQNFAQFLPTTSLARRVPIVYFYADWCGPCRRFRNALPSPEVDKALQHAVLIKVNIDRCQDLAAHYGVTVVPTFVKVNAQGQAVAAITGDAWGEDVPANIAPVMAALVNGGAYDHLNLTNRVGLDR